MNKNEILRQLPKMDRILQEPEAEELCRLYGKNRILGILRQELDSLRKELLEGKATEAAVENAQPTELFISRLLQQARERTKALEEPLIDGFLTQQEFFFIRILDGRLLENVRWRPPFSPCADFLIWNTGFRKEKEESGRLTMQI